MLQVPPKLQESFISWKEGRKLCNNIFSPQKIENLSGHPQQNIGMVKFSRSQVPRANMRAVGQGKQGRRKRNSNGYHQLNSLARLLSSQQACKASQLNLNKECNAYDKNLSILSMHVPVTEIFTVS